MELFSLLVIFTLGMFLGASAILAYGTYRINKIKRVKDNMVEAIKLKSQELEAKQNSIKERLMKASELAQAQLAIKAQLEMPSKNALHSKYKNELGGELQNMEIQKLDILRTVLAEGFDPMITVINEVGIKQEIPLSAYVDSASQQLNAHMGNQPPPPPAEPGLGEPRKVGKFILYKGGKDDGTTH
jgi:hypothetical protein